MQYKNMENSNIYYDTNIFINLFDSTRVGSKETILLTEKFIKEGANLFINSDTITNTFYILSKTKIYTHEKLLEILKKTISLFRVVCIENKETIKAIELCENIKNNHKDYEDSLQYICAKKVDANLIITNDKGFYSKDIELLSSVEFVLKYLS